MVLSERSMQIVQELQNHHGIKTFTAIIETALMLFYRETFPAYLMGKQMANGKETRTAEQVAQDKVALKTATKQAEKEADYAKKRRICEVVLGGRVEPDPNVDGEFICYYDDETMEESTHQQLPLYLLNAQYAETQFTPNKEAVLRARPELKKKYTHGRDPTELASK